MGTKTQSPLGARRGFSTAAALVLAAAPAAANKIDTITFSGHGSWDCSDFETFWVSIDKVETKRGDGKMVPNSAVAAQKDENGDWEGVTVKIDWGAHKNNQDEIAITLKSRATKIVDGKMHECVAVSQPIVLISTSELEYSDINLHKGGNVDFSMPLHRVDLNNGRDAIYAINDPTIGSDPLVGDYYGDLYWKVYPASALERCDGTNTITGLEYEVFDQDWIVDGATLWAYSITTGVQGTDTTIYPDFSSTAVIVPEVTDAGLPNPAGAGACPSVGYVAGWVMSEAFYDTMGEPVELASVNDNLDIVFTHFAPGGQPLSGANSCGTEGNATLSWTVSDDEGTPDWTGFGNNRYGGFSIGGAGVFAPIPEPHDSIATAALFFDEPTLSMGRYDPETGWYSHSLAGLEFPLGIDLGCNQVTPVQQLGAKFDYVPPDSGTSFAFLAMNIEQTWLDLTGFCLQVNGGLLATNPGDPIFASSMQQGGIGIAQDEPSPLGGDFTSRVWTSSPLPVPQLCGLIDVELRTQAFSLDSGQNLTTSNVVRTTLRASN